MTDQLKDAPLGKEVSYEQVYNPGLLFSISRDLNRKEIGLKGELPFCGVDYWNAYELSWLSEKGKPQIAVGEFAVPCISPNIIESKSLKLYLNSFNQTKFSSGDEVKRALIKDLSAAAGADVVVKILHPEECKEIDTPDGTCLDDLDVEIDTYEVSPDLLKMESEDVIEEKLFSRLLRSNCLKTGQPDWATVCISYKGQRINHKALLRYLVSHRNHQGFHEDTVEKIYVDLIEKCFPEKLTVYARYTRRGGLDINPFRSNFEESGKNTRFARQ